VFVVPFGFCHVRGAARIPHLPELLGDDVVLSD